MPHKTRQFGRSNIAPGPDGKRPAVNRRTTSQQPPKIAIIRIKFSVHSGNAPQAICQSPGPCDMPTFARLIGPILC